MAGRKREYETIYILRPDSTTTSSPRSTRRSAASIEAGGGTLLKVDNWGKRKLAYEVKKQLKGIYLFFAYLGTAGLVEEVERNLRLTDSVIRYYSVKIAENVDPAARTSRVHRGGVRQGRHARPRRGGDRHRPGQRRARRSTRTRGAFDFEEAVFGGVDEPGAAGGRVRPWPPRNATEGKGERGERGGDDKKRPVGRRKLCKFCADETIKIDYKDAVAAQVLHHRPRQAGAAPDLGQLRQAPARDRRGGQPRADDRAHAVRGDGSVRPCRSF